MKNNQLIATNTLWYKISNLFKNLFTKKEKEEYNILNIKNSNFIDNISLRDKMVIYAIQKETAKNLMTGNLKIESLSNEEVNDMIKYFIEYNNKMSQDLKRIKKNIIDLRNNINWLIFVSIVTRAEKVVDNYANGTKKK